MKKVEIQKSHELVIAGVNHSVEAQNLFAILCLEVKRNYDALCCFDENNRKKPYKEITDLDIDKIPLSYSISRHQLAEIMGTGLSQFPKPNTKSERAVKVVERIDKATDLLMGPIKIKNPQGYSLNLEYFRSMDQIYDANGWVKINLIRYCVYNEDGLQVVFWRDGIEMIVNEIRGFALVDLRLFFKVKGKYSKRLLDLITKYHGGSEIKISELERLMGVKLNEYKKSYNFIQAVIEKPLMEIVKASNEVAQTEDIGGIWECEENFPKGYEVVRSNPKVTTGNDKIRFHMVFRRDKARLSKNSKNSPTMAEEDFITVASKVIAFWRDGNKPTMEQLRPIQENIDLLEHYGCFSKEEFSELFAKIPPKLFG